VVLVSVGTIASSILPAQVRTRPPGVTANWLAASDNRWTLPIGGGVGKILKFGDKFPPINLQLQAFDNVERPHQGGADWQLRFQVQFLFPR
jgi:hypothetical protein